MNLYLWIQLHVKIITRNNAKGKDHPKNTKLNALLERDKPPI